jgi:hypothetical protein
MAVLTDPGWPTERFLLDRIVGGAWRWTLRVVAVACLLGAEVVHTSAVDAHRHWALAGAFFLAISAVEGALAVGLSVLPSRKLYITSIGVSAATVAIWLVSRTSGLPIGPGAGVPEAVGAADAISTFLEVLTVAVLFPLLLVSATGKVPARAKRDWMAAAIAIVTIAALTGVAARSPEAVPPAGRSGHRAIAARPRIGTGS